MTQEQAFSLHVPEPSQEQLQHHAQQFLAQKLADSDDSSAEAQLPELLAWVLVDGLQACKERGDRTACSLSAADALDRCLLRLEYADLQRSDNEVWPFTCHICCQDHLFSFYGDRIRIL